MDEHYSSLLRGTTTRLVLTVPVRPTSLNAERRQHWAQRGTLTEVVKSAAYLICKQAMRGRKSPLFREVIVTVTPHAMNRRFRHDVGNAYPTAKACIDGFVEAGLLDDDDDTHLKELRFLPTEYGTDEMWFTIEGLLA